VFDWFDCPSLCHAVETCKITAAAKIADRISVYDSALFAAIGAAGASPGIEAERSNKPTSAVPGQAGSSTISSAEARIYKATGQHEKNDPAASTRSTIETTVF
jgi:hypothetical protein